MSHCIEDIPRVVLLRNNEMIEIEIIIIFFFIIIVVIIMMTNAWPAKDLHHSIYSVIHDRWYSSPVLHVIHPRFPPATIASHAWIHWLMLRQLRHELCLNQEAFYPWWLLAAVLALGHRSTPAVWHNPFVLCPLSSFLEFFLTFRDHLHIFVGQSWPSFSSTVCFQWMSAVSSYLFMSCLLYCSLLPFPPYNHVHHFSWELIFVSFPDVTIQI